MGFSEVHPAGEAAPGERVRLARDRDDCPPASRGCQGATFCAAGTGSDGSGMSESRMSSFTSSSVLLSTSLLQLRLPPQHPSLIPLRLGRVPHPNVVPFDVRVGFHCRLKLGRFPEPRNRFSQTDSGSSLPDPAISRSDPLGILKP